MNSSAKLENVTFCSSRTHYTRITSLCIGKHRYSINNTACVKTRYTIRHIHIIMQRTPIVINLIRTHACVFLRKTVVTRSMFVVQV